jgi:hypothetical protein
MTFAGAIFLIAAGAIIRYALNVNIEGINEDVVGLILMIAGVAGLIFAAIAQATWAERWRRTRVVDDGPYRDDPRY